MNQVEAIPPQPAAIHIPLFALYGERSWPHEHDGMHIEALQVRSSRYNWTIQPHRHPTLNQLIWLSSGAGTFHVDGQEEEIAGPLLLSLPPGVAHGFRWRDDVVGFVLTPTPHLLQEVVPEENSELFDKLLVLAPSPLLAAGFDRSFAYLMSEFGRGGAGRRAGLAAGILQIASLIARLEAAGEGAYLSAEANLTRRFRKLVEVSFWKHLKLEDYCAALGVTTGRLSRACRIAVGQSPLAIIHERILVAAKRKLTYSTISISEIGFELGFADPAYFSRFFSKHNGSSPGEYRAARRSTAFVEEIADAESPAIAI